MCRTVVTVAKIVTAANRPMKADKKYRLSTIRTPNTQRKATFRANVVSMSTAIRAVKLPRFNLGVSFDRLSFQGRARNAEARNRGYALLLSIMEREGLAQTEACKVHVSSRH